MSMHDPGTRTLEAQGAPIGNGRLAIMLFVASEIMLFAGIVAGYVVLRFGGAGKMGAGIPPGASPVATFLLVASTLALVPVPRLLGRRPGAARLLTLAALLLGLGFLLLGALDWRGLLVSGAMGLNVRSGASGLLVGLHFLHAILGLVLLALPLLKGSAVEPGHVPGTRISPVGRFGSLASVATFYWHFVTLTWIALVGALYLL